MAELRTSIVIDVKGANAAKAVEEIKRQFGQLGQSARDADAAGGQLGRTRNALQSISTQLSQVRAAFVALQGVQAAAQGLRNVFATADAYTNLNARLKLVTGSQGEFNAVFSQLRSLADRTLAPLQETAQAFTRISPAVKNLGGSFRETLALTEAVTLSLRISGASAEEQASALLQFAQGLQSNFQGDEFRSLTENAPRLLQAVADGMGRSVTELKALSAQGKLTADVVGNALIKALQQLQREAAGLPVTVAGAFQVLQNAALQYVGTVDQARGVSGALAQVVVTLARNFKTLADAVTLLVVGLAALGIGRLVGAFAGLITAGGSVAGVFARLVALIGGKAGFVGVVVTATAALIAFFKAGGENAGDGLETRLNKMREKLRQVREESETLAGDRAPPRDKEDPQIEALLKQREELANKGAALTSRRRILPGASENTDELRVLDEQIAKLRAQSDELKVGNEEIQRRGELNRKLTAPPKSIEEATQGLATRTEILQKFEARTKDIDSAFAAQIKRASEQGDTVRARELEQQKRESQAAAVRERDSALKGLEGPAGPSQRLPTLREDFDAIFKLTKDRLDREKEALELSQKDQLIAIQGYFDERRRIADDEEANDLARLTRERSAQEKLIADLAAARGKTKVGDTSQREQIDDQTFAALQKIREINADIQIAQARRFQEGRKLASDQAQAEGALDDQLAQVKERLDEIAGVSGGQDVRDKLLRQFKPLLDQLRAEGNVTGEQRVLRLVDNEGSVAELRKVEDQFNAALTRMRAAEESINIKRQAGLLSESTARQMILKLHQDTAAEVENLIPSMEALAAAIPGQEAQNRVAGIKVEFERLKTVVDDVALAVNSAVRDSFQTMFEDIASGAKSAKQIMLDFFRSIEQAITKIAAREFADQLFGGTGTGGVGGFISALLGKKSIPIVPTGVNIGDFHRGGIVGVDGRRHMVNPLAFLAAPRFHSGGIGGLGPDEIPAILQRGEEVLPRSDPRHRMNGGQIINVNITTPDVAGFRRALGEIQAELASAAARGRRNQ